jgi:hypothetical protein
MKVVIVRSATVLSVILSRQRECDGGDILTAETAVKAGTAAVFLRVFAAGYGWSHQ